MVLFETLIKKVRLSIRKDRESYFRLYKILGFYPKDIQLYQQALLHKSVSARTSSGDRLNNERLEFLGDAILESIVTTYLYRHFPRESEGFLSVARSCIVCRESLNRLGHTLGLDKVLRIDIPILTHNSYLCGNAFEALIGAIYLDQGYRTCQRFVEQNILSPHIDLHKLVEQRKNFKSQILEWAQSCHISVSFKLAEQRVEQGNSQIFRTELYLNGILSSEGSGYTKKESHQQAAATALHRLRTDSDFRSLLFPHDSDSEILSSLSAQTP